MGRTTFKFCIKTDEVIPQSPASTLRLQNPEIFGKGALQPQQRFHVV
jgi:hypothetical protein